jgi:hypothetical protein
MKDVRCQRLGHFNRGQLYIDCNNARAARFQAAPLTGYK